MSCLGTSIIFFLVFPMYITYRNNITEETRKGIFAHASQCMVPMELKVTSYKLLWAPLCALRRVECPILWESSELNIILSTKDIIIVFNTGFLMLCLEIVVVHQFPQ